MSEENLEIARLLLAANRSGPAQETREVALSLTDPAVEFRSRITAVEGAEYLGHEGVDRYFDDMADAFRAWRNEADEIVELGPDAVLIDNVFHAIGKDSGMEVELRSAIVFLVSARKVVGGFSYATREQALGAAGLTE